jgi:DNA-binding response OmpR family regulator
MHALIIENEFFTADLIQDGLAEIGFTSFATVRDEDEAVAEAALHHPDLITADVELDHGCGIDAVRRICDVDAIPVVYITGTAWLVRDRCPSAIIIQKPFGMASLREGVRNAYRG